MVQIQLPEQEKQVVEEERRAGVEAGQVGEDPLLPTTVHQSINKRQRQQATSKSCVILVLLSCLFAILTVKKICDLNEQNLFLRQQLALERQKDSALKMAVRDNIPSARFLGHRFTKAQVELLESESQLPVPVSSWTINLSILWASDEITPCDMHQLSHLLADEIYNKLEAKEEEWLEEEEEEEEIRDPDAASVLEKALGSDLDAEIQKYYAEKYEEKSLLSEWGDSEEEGYGSSEETSSEEYDEEAIADTMLGKEEDTIAKEEEEEDPFHENDYDYMADVRGEYDEVEVEKEVEGLVEQTLYDSDDYYK